MSWLPLESNPDVMNKFLYKLGVPEKWQIVDVLGLDEDMLNVVPRPVLSLLLLFPTSDKYEEHKAALEAEVKEKGQEVSDKVFFMKQTITNACGTIALIHSVANNMEDLQLGDGPLKQFLEDALPLSPEERGELINKADGIINTHKEVAQEGQTSAPGDDEPVQHHFVAFVHKDGHLYELDGRKCSPIDLGETTPDSLLEDAAKVCKQYMERDPEELHFTVVALTAA